MNNASKGRDFYEGELECYSAFTAYFPLVFRFSPLARIFAEFPGFLVGNHLAHFYPSPTFGYS
jgi:hypothetical protein